MFTKRGRRGGRGRCQIAAEGRLETRTGGESNKWVTRLH